MILALILSSVMTINAQVYAYRTYAFAKKVYGYEWSNFVSSDLLVTINLNTDVIRIDNNQNSCFNVLSAREYYDKDNEWNLECKCTDEERIRCTVRLILRSDGTSQMYVDYSNISVCYNLRKLN